MSNNGFSALFPIVPFLLRNLAHGQNLKLTDRFSKFVSSFHFYSSESSHKHDGWHFYVPHTQYFFS